MVSYSTSVFPPETAFVSSRFCNEIAVDRSLRGCRSGSLFILTRAATTSMIAYASKSISRTQRRSLASRCCFSLLVLLLLIGLATPPLALAAQTSSPGSPWGSASTEHFVFLAPDTSEIDANAIAAALGPFAETALAEAHLVFDLALPTEAITIYAFDDPAAYEAYHAGTASTEIDAVLAIANIEERSIGLPLDEFSRMTPTDAENQIRHAIAHLVLQEASSGRAPRGFDEGFALYFERPNQPRMARWAAVIQDAHGQGKLASWSNLNRAEPLDDDTLIEAEAFAVVSYLIKNQGLPEFRAFVTSMASTENWREAATLAYAPTDSDNLERQWKDNIPVWLSSDWRWNLIAGFDLAPATELLDRGSFEAASSALLVSEQLLSDVDAPELEQTVAALKDSARVGVLAEVKMVETQNALENFAYDRAAAAVMQAEEQYAQLPPELRPDALLATYRSMAEQGLAATDQLERARILEDSWGDYPETRALALESGNAFSALGDAENASASSNVLKRIDDNQMRLVLLLGALAFLTSVWLILWLRGREPDGIRWD